MTHYLRWGGVSERDIWGLNPQPKLAVAYTYDLPEASPVRDSAFYFGPCHYRIVVIIICIDFINVFTFFIQVTFCCVF